MRADISGGVRQVVGRGLARIRETRDEKRRVRVTICFNLFNLSCDMKVVMKKRHSVQFVYTFQTHEKPSIHHFLASNVSTFVSWIVITVHW